MSEGLYGIIRWSDMTSEFRQHEPCPECGSRDNLARYSDGHGYCFGCGYYETSSERMGSPAVSVDHRFSDGGNHILTATEADFALRKQDGEFTRLKKRGISQETCEKWGYQVGRHQGQTIQIANYYENNKLVAQKIRKPDKTFSVLGRGKNLPLYGQWLWNGGKMVVVTEGEIDALSVSQIQNNRWPVVSVPNGASGAARTIKQQLSWLENFDKVVFMFDMDNPGQSAAKECASLLTPGKAAIARLSAKDPNDLLVAGKSQEVIQAIWNAQVYRPDGIISKSEVWEEITRPVSHVCVPYPWQILNEKFGGLRRGELVTITAGSGIGKSAVAREIAYHLVKTDETIGYIALEESVKRTAMGLMGLEMNVPLHLDLRSWTELTNEERTKREEAFQTIFGAEKVFLYDHFGSVEVENLLQRIRFLSRGCDCNWIILDHLSIMVSGLEIENERQAIDRMMTMLRSLVEETGIGLIVVSHLKRPQGEKGHEEGVTTHLRQLRGSHAIAQLSDIVIGLERNQQHETNSDVLTVRGLKNRFSGIVGIAGNLYYNRKTGRLGELEEEIDWTNDTAVGF